MPLGLAPGLGLSAYLTYGLGIAAIYEFVHLNTVFLSTRRWTHYKRSIYICNLTF